MNKEKFCESDSWAFWDIPKDLDKETCPCQVYEAMKNKYDKNRKKDMGFPKEYLDKIPPVNTVKYVFIGLNPGNAEINHDTDFNNFHGNPRSGDWRLAAAVYGTKAWGAFMTDIIHVHKSDSSEVEVTEQAVTDLIEHLTKLGIPKSAKLIFMGTAKFKKISELVPKDYKKQIFIIHHYGYLSWNPCMEHNRIIKITNGDSTAQIAPCCLKK